MPPAIILFHFILHCTTLYHFVLYSTLGLIDFIGPFDWCLQGMQHASISCVSEA